MLLPDKPVGPDFIALYEACKTFPSEPIRLRILADYCEEYACDADARLYRWMAKHNKRPYERHTYPETGRKVPDRFAWTWWCEKWARMTGDKDHAVLPVAIFVCLLENDSVSMPHKMHEYYPSEQDALSSLRHALTVGSHAFSL